MIQTLLKNWKTTSAGLTMIIGSTVHLIFEVKSGKTDETAWTISLGAIVGGLGLLFSRDSSAAAADHAESKSLIAAVDAKVETNTVAIQDNIASKS